MKQHTLGPWVSHGTIVYFPKSRGGFNIANCPDAEANACLIAAAPDLLAVCQELEESASYWSEYDVPLCIVDRLKAAIAKATGEK
jgi:hypothetical protein